MSKLLRSNDGEEEQLGPTHLEVFQEQAVDRAATSWTIDGTAEEKWTVMRSALVESAAASLPIKEQHHPDCFGESADVLMPYSAGTSCKAIGSPQSKLMTICNFRKHEEKLRKLSEGTRTIGLKTRLRKWNRSSLVGRSGRALGTCNEDGGACYLQ